MLVKTKILLSLLVLLLLAAGGIIWFNRGQNVGLAVGPAPTISLSGDDYNLNGAADDPYDSFLVARPVSNLDYFLDYFLDYSIDGGQAWNNLPVEARLADGVTANPVPVLYWDFEEGSGSTIHNRVGNDTVTANGSFDWQESLFSKTGNFTGGSLSALPVNMVKDTAGTISFWLYPASVSTQEYIFRFCTDGSCNSNNRLFFRLEPNGGATFGISNVLINFPAGTVTANTWQHFVVSYGAGLYQVYKNGAPIQNGGFNNFNINGSMTLIPLINGFAYNGYLDEVKIFNQALSSVQISNIYNGVNNYQSNLIYYWPLNAFGSQDLLVRVRAKTARGISDAGVQTVKVRHRFGSRGRNYFVENFLTQTWKGTGSAGFWNNASGTLQFSNQSTNCPNNPVIAVSSDLLAGLGLKLPVTKVLWQAVQMMQSSSSIKYEFSTNGSNWQSGQTVTTTSVSNPQLIVFNQPATSLYWRATFNRGASCVLVDQPKVYGLRLSWEYNHEPRACFKVSPTRSSDPNHVFTFNGSCSSDLEDGIAGLNFAWDFNNDGQTDQIGQSVTHSFATTSEQTVGLTVTDQSNATGTFKQKVNSVVFTGGKINGWGWSPTWGWLSLNCENIYNGVTAARCKSSGQSQSDYGLSVNENDYSVTGYGWSDNLGWLCFGATCSTQGLNQAPDNKAPFLLISNVNGNMSGWAKVLSMGQEGWLRFDNPENTSFNVHFNTSTQSLEGMAWGAFVDNVNPSTPYGIGPVSFSRSFASYPWLETKYGNIYSLQGLGSANMVGAPSSSLSAAGVRYNATYCLLTNGRIVNFRSQSANCSREQYSQVGFPEPSNNYQTPLGFLPINDLRSQAIKSNSLIEESNLNNYFGSSWVLNNKVYYFTGSNDYYLTDPTTFLNNISINGSGAGTIVVAGNLHVSGDLFYDNGHLVGKIGNLASVAFVVLGDVFIDSKVSHLVGSWLVLGNNNNQSCLNGAIVCGQFSTGDDTAEPTQLTFQGLVLARQFNLERKFRQGVEPAEKFIYDGRVNVNTPPGLHSVSFNLPAWNSQ